MEKLTIACTTIGRQDSIKNLLKSIEKTVKIPHSIIIVNSGSKLNLKYKSKFNSTFNIFNYDKPLRVPKARNIIFDKCESSYLLIMDDDMVLEEDTVSSLIKVLNIHAEIDILGCAVLEYGRWRDIGFRMFVVEKESKRVVYKDPIYKQWLDENKISLCNVDIITQPPWLIRKSIYKNIKFDENYPWASDIFDFFMECKNNNIISAVTPNIKVKHEPKSYSPESNNFKQNKLEGNKIGKKYFEEKWGMAQEKLPERPLLIRLFKDYLIKRSRRIMIKNKIKIDGVNYK